MRATQGSQQTQRCAARRQRPPQSLARSASNLCVNHWLPAHLQVADGSTSTIRRTHSPPPLDKSALPAAPSTRHFVAGTALVTWACVACLAWPGGASAHIPLTTQPQAAALAPETNLGFAPGQFRSLGQQRPSGAPQASTAERARDAIARLEAAHDQVHAGQYQQALDSYTYVITQHGDLALASFARTGRALMLYQLGRTSDAVLALEAQEVAVRGTAEVHAALAAVLWTERPTLAFRAEQEWEVAREFDGRYSDVRWVEAAKHWPPRALDALQRFLLLQRRASPCVRTAQWSEYAQPRVDGVA